MGKIEADIFVVRSLRIAQAVGAQFGLEPTDKYTLVQRYYDPDSGSQHATVRVGHGPCTYLVNLYQRVKQGPWGAGSFKVLGRCKRVHDLCFSEQKTDTCGTHGCNPESFGSILSLLEVHHGISEMGMVMIPAAFTVSSLHTIGGTSLAVLLILHLVKRIPGMRRVQNFWISVVIAELVFGLTSP